MGQLSLDLNRYRAPSRFWAFVYVDTLYGNPEMIALRNHLMGDPCST